jgi:alginate O-acetyltransferase complex protein AlgJ
MLLALAFFFGPLGAFLLGVRPEAIENRALADFPSLTQGWSFFPSVTSWATDHLPLRAEAVRLNAALSERVFHESPSYRRDTAPGPVPGNSTPKDSGGDPNSTQYPQVLEGKDGWLYFGPDTSNPCQATRSVPDVLDRINRLARAVEDSGRTFVVTVAPDKSTMYPDALPETYLGKDCSTERRTEFWQALKSSPPTGYLDVRGPLETEQHATGDPIYRPTDTHWGPRGAAVYVQQLASRLDPALMQGTEFVETGPTSEPGDLSAMIGLPHDDAVMGVALSREGVTPVGRESLDVPEMPSSPETFTNRTSGAPLFQPRTLLLGDSFTNASKAMVGQFFSSLTLLQNETAGADPQAVADAMSESDVVVYEIVERTIDGGGATLLDDAALSAAEATLAANPR